MSPRPRMLTAWGRTQSVQAWARELHLSPETIFTRLKAGKPHEECLEVNRSRKRASAADERDESSDGARWALPDKPRDESGEVIREYLPGGADEMWPGANDVRYMDDHVARVMVRDHGPFTLGEVSAFLGVCRQRVNQIEIDAIRKLAKHADRTIGEVRQLLVELTSRPNPDEFYPSSLDFGE